MKWMSWVAFALLCASCAAPKPPEDWTIERQASDSSAGADSPIAVCEDMCDLALGSHADSEDLTATLDELARMSAIVGATAALPALNRATTALDAGAAVIDVHDDLASAADAIDPPSLDVCLLPVFTALYAAGGWPACYGELAIPVAGYTVIDPQRGCSSVGSPSYLPCWTDSSPFLPVDCNTGDVVHVVDGTWVPAGEPREVVVATTLPPVTEDEPEDEPEAEPEPEDPPDPTLAFNASPECARVADLFTGPDPVKGRAEDLWRLRTATSGLKSDVGRLVEEFIAANTDTPSLEEFESIVLQLDQATAEQCGLPLISAFDALAGGVDELPCWAETGLALPAYTPADCRD
jgi:hypothetical protein